MFKSVYAVENCDKQVFVHLDTEGIKYLYADMEVYEEHNIELQQVTITIKLKECYGDKGWTFVHTSCERELRIHNINPVYVAMDKCGITSAVFLDSLPSKQVKRMTVAILKEGYFSYDVMRDSRSFIEYRVSHLSYEDIVVQIGEEYRTIHDSDFYTMICLGDIDVSSAKRYNLFYL
jgi:hypothetical protein